MRSRALWPWLMITPALAMFAGLALLPMYNLLQLSLHYIRYVRARPVATFVGLQQYADLLNDDLFKSGILNTAIFAVVAVSAEIVLGFMLALMTTRIVRGRLFYRTVFILPILVPGIVVGAIWKLMYSYDFGILNQLLAAVHLPPTDWLGNVRTALGSVIAVDVWHWTPLVFLLMLAALESLPQDIYEAAKVDGVNGWQELRHITLPLVAPAILVMLIFRLVVACKVFDEVYLLTGGGPGTATEVVSFTIYQRFFVEGQTGYGSAMSVAVLTIVALVIVAFVIATRRKEVAS